MTSREEGDCTSERCERGHTVKKFTINNVLIQFQQDRVPEDLLFPPSDPSPDPTPAPGK